MALYQRTSTYGADRRLGEAMYRVAGARTGRARHPRGWRGALDRVARAARKYPSINQYGVFLTAGNCGAAYPLS